MAGIADRVRIFLEGWPIARKQLEELTAGDSQEVGEEEIVDPGAVCEAMGKQEGGKTA